jgi:hypothetical protein
MYDAPQYLVGKNFLEEWFKFDENYFSLGKKKLQF